MEKRKMKLLERYEEVIERDAREIPYAWKGAMILTYSLCSLSSYACSIAFHVFWHEACGGHCFFWAEAYSQVPTGAGPRYWEAASRNLSDVDDWTKDILIVNQKHRYCEWLHFVCLLSCFASIALLIMFSICGKGGYDPNLFTAPWRIVVPAFIVNSFMMILTMTAANLFTGGYSYFTEKLYQLIRDIPANEQKPLDRKRHCEVFQAFARNNNKHDYDFCKLYAMTQIFTWTMSWSWTVGALVLSLRVLTSVDFNLLEVNIYEKSEESLVYCEIPETTPRRGLNYDFEARDRFFKGLAAFGLKRRAKE